MMMNHRDDQEALPDLNDITKGAANFWSPGIWI